VSYAIICNEKLLFNVFDFVQENMPYGTCEKQEEKKPESNLMMIAKLTAEATKGYGHPSTKPTLLGLSVFVVTFVSLLSTF